MKKTLKILLILLLCVALLPFQYFSFADEDGGGDDNAGTGDGDTGGKVEGKGFYRSGEWMYKVSLYVGLSDTAVTSTSFYFGYKNIGDPVYVKPSSFSLSSGTIFGKYNKVEYLRGKNLESDNNPKIVVDNPPAIPITNGGKLSEVKSYFGDEKTLKALINNVAQQQGTSREGLVSNIEFTIDGVTGKQDPKDILPIKGTDGQYHNRVPWVIIYEPVTIAHLKDGNTKLAFTATEYAIAQQNGMFNFFYSGSDAQFIAGMTHCNLPNSVVLEKNWFDYTAFPPTENGEKWSYTRILRGGGWGMRIMYPNGTNSEEPIEPPNPVPDDPDEGEKQTGDLSIGDYRTDTDVITSFVITTSGRITPDDVATVKFKVGGNTISTTDVVLPAGGSQLVWCKWHTPTTPQTMTVTAAISGNGNAKFEGGGRSTEKVVKIVNLDENIPPDPVAKDPNTGKPVQKPSGWKIPRLPSKADKRSNTWGEWSAEWIPDWVWHENWKRVWTGDRDEDGHKIYEWEDHGKWVDEGDWEYYWNTFSATLSANYSIKPDEKVPTAKQYYSDWEMKSGYGINIDADINVTTDAPSSAVAKQGNMINLFPEFNYNTYCRLSERMGSGEFQLKHNEYSTYNQRVHFTPLWFPDDEKYTTYSEIIDVWTPAGQLTMALNDFVNIKGSVMDDWRVVPGDSHED